MTLKEAQEQYRQALIDDTIKKSNTENIKLKKEIDRLKCEISKYIDVNFELGEELVKVSKENRRLKGLING